MGNTDFFFDKGKLSIVMDAGAGSSGKGKLGAYLCQNSDKWSFACNAFMPQAGHWVVNDDGKKYFYQTFNSCAAMHDRYDALYIGPGATIELPALFREIEENNIPRHKVRISPQASILQQIDQDFERGIVDFDGNVNEKFNNSLSMTGTTAHGCGANRARRVLRRPEARYAKDVRELKQFVCDVSEEIMSRLEKGESGMLEIAQGYQLSNMTKFYPNVTSRNCTVAAALDDMMLPPIFAGQVFLNVRAFPIRINNNKYVALNGVHLTWAQKKECDDSTALDGLKRYDVLEGYSGDGYRDQRETSWETITEQSGSPTPIMEMTSVTKLPRRVFSFSNENIVDAVRHNKTGHDMHISINFINYVDHSFYGNRGKMRYHQLPGKMIDWLHNNTSPMCRALLKVLGTGPKTEDTILLG